MRNLNSNISSQQYLTRVDLHRWYIGKGSTCQSGRCRGQVLDPGSGRSPGGRHGYPLQYSYLENSMDTGAWWAI